MATIQKNEPIIAGNFKVKYEERSLLGILKWWKEIRADRWGNDLYVIDEYAERVFINGREYVPAQKLD